MSIESLSGVSAISSNLNPGQELTSGESASALDKQTVGAQVVTATLDKLNSGPGSSGGSDYDFQKDVLSGMLAGKGIITDNQA
jgi:hypothetical protein